MRITRQTITRYAEVMISSVRQSKEQLTLTSLLVAAILVRFRNLETPISGSYTFRNTQTAWGIRSVANGALSPFSIETPVLGPPWKIPFEFPLYQMIAGLLSRVTGYSTELSGRLTSLTFFIMAGLIFYCICRCFFSQFLSTLVLALFLFNSHNLEYGSSVLIEYCAVFFALASFLFAIKYFDTCKEKFLILYFVFGSISALVKITTSFVWVILGVLAINFIRGTNRWILIRCLVVGAIGHIPSFAWTRWTDLQKSKSKMTDWLTSANLQEWNFGSLRQRLFYFDWERSIGQIFLPSLVGVTAVAVGLIVLALSFSANLKTPLAFLLLFLSGPIIFTNLYFVHDYYWTAVLPAFLILIGFGLQTFSIINSNSKKFIENRIHIFQVLIVISLVSASWFSAYGKRHFDVFIKPGSLSWNDERVEIAVRAINNFTKPEEKIIIVGSDWNPQILYFADRKGLMIPTGWSLAEVISDQKLKSNFEYIYWYSDTLVDLADAKTESGEDTLSSVAPNLYKLGD